ncbi:unnamed protein product [Cladocopium goreaui]|nr:unnamed protein product [Cladocopium goreaui]
MELQALQPDIIMQNSLLSASVRHHWQLALVDLRSKGYQPDQVTMGIVVKASERWQAAQASLASACRASAVSVVSYGAALSAAERQTAWEQVGKLHRDLQVKGLQLNTVIYNTWITSRREHDWRIAVSLYNSLQEMLLQPTVVTLSAMITGVALAWQLAMEFLREIREQQLQGNLVAYNAAISSCEKASQWTWALHLQQEAAAESLHPNVITCSAAVSACEKAAEWEPALSLLLCAGKQQVEKNLVTYNAFLGACQNAWQWKRSLAILRSLSDADVISHTSAVTSLGETSQWCRSTGLLAELNTWRIQADFSLLSAITSAMAPMAQAWREAVEMQELLPLMHQKPGVSFVNSLLRACHAGSAWRQSTQVLSAQHLSRLVPDELALQSALLGSLTAGAFTAARRILDDLATGLREEMSVPKAVSMRDYVEDLFGRCKGRPADLWQTFGPVVFQRLEEPLPLRTAGPATPAKAEPVSNWVQGLQFTNPKKAPEPTEPLPKRKAFRGAALGCQKEENIQRKIESPWHSDGPLWRSKMHVGSSMLMHKRPRSGCHLKVFKARRPRTHDIS